jgi:hypothetical protein
MMSTAIYLSSTLYDEFDVKLGSKAEFRSVDDFVGGTYGAMNSRRAGPTQIHLKQRLRGWSYC